MTPSLLALDTSGDACSVAVLCHGRVLHRHERVPREHARCLLDWIVRLLEEAGQGLADLDGIAFGAGPGSFTGLRIAAGVTQGLALASERPVFPISSLQGLASGEQRRRSHAEGDPSDCEYWSVVDARMGEVYLGSYRAGPGVCVEAIRPERLCKPERVMAPTGPTVLCGSGVGLLSAEILDSPHVLAQDSQHLTEARDLLPMATSQWQQGAGVPADRAFPVYLRNEVAWKKKS